MDSNSELPLSDLKVEDVFVSFMKRRPNLSIATIDEEYTENDRESDWIELSEELNAKFAEKSLEEWKKVSDDTLRLVEPRVWQENQLTSITFRALATGILKRYRNRNKLI